MSDIVVPYYKIIISGKEIDKKLYNLVGDISIKETSKGSSTCTIRLTDPDMTFIQGSMIVESTPIKVVFGIKGVPKTIYSTTDNTLKGAIATGDQERVFEGYVSVIDASFPKDGLPTVTLHCMDKTHLMNRKLKKRTWENTTESAVAEKIYREYGFKVQVTDSVKKKESIQQSDITDIAFITQLVDAIEDKHFITFIDGETAYFNERLAPVPKYQFNYRLAPYNLYSFSPRVNKESKKEPFKQMDVNLKTLKIEDTTVSADVKNLGSIKVQNTSTRK